MRKPLMKVRGSAIISCLILTVLLTTFPVHSLAQNQKDRANFDRLTQIAWSEGTVRVIVRLDVPRIKELTAASAKFWIADANEAIRVERTAADTALKDAIEYTAWKVLAELQGTNYDVNTIYRSIPFIALRVSPYALALLEDSTTVLGLEEDIPIKLIEPVEESGGEKGKTSLTNSGDLDRPFLDVSVDLIGAKTAWGWGYTGAGWYVAVLDTGIRKTHQFFTGKTIVEACFALGSDGVGGTGDCPNGNATMTGPGSAVHHSSTYTSYDHGTHVSGIATGNYGSLAGVAKNANIIAVQVFSKFTGNAISSWNSDTLAGLDYIYSIRGSYNIAAVNMSLGGSTRYSYSCDSDSRKASIDNLRSVGIATAIATGNNGWCTGISSPGCISTSVSVGSSTDSDGESYFNNWHATLQKLFAPGSYIYSSTGASDSSYASWNGTSMATPHVAGAWALLKHRLSSGSVTDFLNALRTTGVSVTSVCDGYATPIPRIRVDRAIASFPTGYTLTIQTSQYGTTNPTPGTYTYDQGTQVQVTATPDTNCEFVNWTGSISSTQNPVTVTMDANKTVKANFRVKPKLTIQAGTGGTTNPIPGVYYYATGTTVQVSAIPDTYFIFNMWGESATGSANPVSLTMDSDKSLYAHFRYIYPPIATGRKVLNRTFSQAEYINILSWQANPSNAGLDITKYRIYQMSGTTPSLLVELASSQLEYYHRNVGQTSIQYTIVAVTSSNREGAPATVTIQ
jgi:hypothetical protein